MTQLRWETLRRWAAHERGWRPRGRWWRPGHPRRWHAGSWDEIEWRRTASRRQARTTRHARWWQSRSHTGRKSSRRRQPRTHARRHRRRRETLRQEWRGRNRREGKSRLPGQEKMSTKTNMTNARDMLRKTINPMSLPTSYLHGWPGAHRRWPRKRRSDGRGRRGRRMLTVSAAAATCTTVSSVLVSVRNFIKNAGGRNSMSLRRKLEHIINEKVVQSDSMPLSFIFHHYLSILRGRLSKCCG